VLYSFLFHIATFDDGYPFAFDINILVFLLLQCINDSLWAVALFRVFKHIFSKKTLPIPLSLLHTARKGKNINPDKHGP
jgi:hypothetical protein